MPLDQTQLQTLKVDIAADPILSLVTQNSDGAFEVAQAYSLQASPDFTVWKNAVPLGEVGLHLVANEIESLTTAENNRMQTFAVYNPETVMPNRPDHRLFFDGVFSGAGGAATRLALDVLWKRLALRVEVLFATGTGTPSDPGILIHIGEINHQTVLAAWSS